MKELLDEIKLCEAIIDWALFESGKFLNDEQILWLVRKQESEIQKLKGCIDLF